MITRSRVNFNTPAPIEPHRARSSDVIAVQYLGGVDEIVLSQTRELSGSGLKLTDLITTTPEMFIDIIRQLKEAGAIPQDV